MDAGDVARERSGIHDITVTPEDGTVVAEVRGRPRMIGGTCLSGAKV